MPWGPITEFVSRRVDGSNYQRISFTSMAAYADPSLTDQANDYRVQVEAGGSATLLPIKFTQQQNTQGIYYEYLTLAPGNDGNVRMFRRTDGPAVTGDQLSLTLGQKQRVTSPVLTTAGQQNSPQFILEGNSYDTQLHTASVRQQVQMTSNAGAATWKLQYSIDGGGYGDLLSATSSGNINLGTLNATRVNSNTLYGALSGGHAIGAASPGGGWGMYHSGTINATSGYAITWQMDANLTAAANNDTLQGLRITSKATKGSFTGVTSYGLYIQGGTGVPYDFGIKVDDASPVYFGGSCTIKPPSSITPVNNGDLTFEATSNTSMRIRYKGSDGVVRSATLTLS